MIALTRHLSVGGRRPIPDLVGANDIVVYEPYFAWEDPSEDELFESHAQKLRDDLSTYAASVDAENPFIYLDYADISQRPLESYGVENVAKIQDAAAKYDPEGVFQHMMPGGFKISQVRNTLTRKTEQTS